MSLVIFAVLMHDVAWTLVKTQVTTTGRVKMDLPHWPSQPQLHTSPLKLYIHTAAPAFSVRGHMRRLTGPPCNASAG